MLGNRRMARTFFSRNETMDPPRRPVRAGAAGVFNR